ncbi:unnamed protein product [Camellia sinensis]
MLHLVRTISKLLDRSGFGITRLIYSYEMKVQCIKVRYKNLKINEIDKDVESKFDQGPLQSLLPSIYSFLLAFEAVRLLSSTMISFLLTT